MVGTGPTGPKTGLGPAVPRLRLGQELAALRRRKGLTGEQVTALMGWQASNKLYRIENGKTGVQALELRELLKIYDVSDPGQHETLMELGRSGKQRNWWAQYTKYVAAPYSTFVGLEQGAVEESCLEAFFPPGLTQTEEFASLVIGGRSPEDHPADVAEKVKLRMERQRVLYRPDGPLKLNVVLDESVLHRQVGGRDVMRRQILHLIELAEMPTVSIRILPFSAGTYPGQTAAFTILEFSDMPPIAYVESLGGDVFPPAGDVPRYTVAFDRLRASALSVTESIELMASTAP